MYFRKLFPTSRLLLAASALAFGCGTAKNGNGSDTEASQVAPSTIEIVTGVIQYCHDGDTCVAKVDGEPITLRLAGIDAPEVMGGPENQGQPFGKEARDFTSGMIKGKTVTIHKIEKDPYDRTVAEIYLGQDLINIKLVENGLAEAYKHATTQINKAAYAAAELHAHNLQMGIWSLQTYVSPSVFRHTGD